MHLIFSLYLYLYVWIFDVSVVLLWCVSGWTCFVFISFVVHKIYWICSLIFSTHLWKILVIFFKYCFVPLYLFSPFIHIIYLLHARLFIMSSMFLVIYSILFLFFCHCVSFKLLPANLSSSALILSLTVPSLLLNQSTEFLIWVFIFFQARIFIWFFALDSSSLLKVSILSCTFFFDHINRNYF